MTSELDLKPTFRSYYFTLEGTGVPEIDAILQIVAAAGKGYHTTEGWDDDSCGPSFITRINEAAANPKAIIALCDALLSGSEA